MTFRADCQHRPECDGCPLFEQAPEDAARAKLARLEEAFRPYDSAPSLPQELVRENDLGYRNRARMVNDNGRLGFYRAESREVVPVEHCLVHHHELEEALAVARPHIVASPLREAVHHLDARRGEHASVLTLVVSEATDGVIGAARALASELQGWGVSVAVTDPSTGAIMSERSTNIAPPETAEMAVRDFRFEAPSSAFYQVNDAVLAAVHERMRAALPDTLPIVDAYCGVGTHGIAVGKGRVTSGFDSNSVAIEAARRNAAKNGVEADFRLLDDASISQAVWPDEPCVTIANPARAGLSHQFIDALADSPSTLLLYLSCEPHTLARDVERLRRHGFDVDTVEAFDMMPRTAHIETLVTLRRGDAPAEHTDEAAYDRDKTLPPGVSGPRVAGEPLRSVWFARVVGRAPHGSPPKIGSDSTPIAVRRLRNVGDQSVIRIEMDGCDAQQLRKRLRRWGYPVVGDEDEGIAAVNALMARREWVDRPLLHAVAIETEAGRVTAPVPGELVRFFRLPEHQLQP